MTTKRTPINRAARHAITPEAVDVFRRACALSPQRLACIRNIADCKSPKPGAEHCSECDEYLETSRALSRLLALKPWHCIDCGAQEPAGLSKAKREKFWTEALEDALGDALDETTR